MLAFARPVNTTATERIQAAVVVVTPAVVLWPMTLAPPLPVNHRLPSAGHVTDTRRTRKSEHGSVVLAMSSFHRTRRGIGRDHALMQVR